MNDGSPKISFSSTPTASPEVVRGHQGQAFAAPNDPSATAAYRPEPAAPTYAAAGFAPHPERPASDFVRRNALPLAVVAIVVLTFVLGAQSALLLSGGSRRDTVTQIQAPQVQVLSASGQLAVQRNDIAQSLNAAVTRAAVADLTSVNGSSESPFVADLAAAVLEGLHPKVTKGKLTQGELAVKGAEAEAVVNNNKLRMLREGVLAGIYTIETTEVGGSKRVRLNTVNAPMATDAIGSLLEQAATEGRIELPKSLRNPEGGLDLDTLMFNLVQTSLANDGTPEGAEAAREMSRQIFAASTAKAEEVDGVRTYTVQSGDSLAYIALQFYGKPSAFDRIFNANQAVLQSPDKIQVGQRLIIPS